MLRAAFFSIDVTPPLGSPLCLALIEPGDHVVEPLTARGIVLAATGQQPVVLCAIDWLGVANEGHDACRAALARGAGTLVSRVAVHTVHQHDAPGFDPAADDLLAARGLGGKLFHRAFAEGVLRALEQAAREALARMEPVTHLHYGEAPVRGIAANRRILGPDGKVQYGRMSACRIPEAVAAPEGVIDPMAVSAGLWNGDRPLVCLNWYATHPMSYYRYGGIGPDFVGMARAARERATGVPHIYFTGAAGNVAPGKYNDGSAAMRLELAARLERGLEAAWLGSQRTAAPVAFEWRVEPVALPLREGLEPEPVTAVLDNDRESLANRLRAGRQLAWARRAKAGHRIELSALRLGPLWTVQMPGELFVEYQLFARRLRTGSDLVTMAAYGDYGPMYIGTEAAYAEGGYETGPVSHVGPKVQGVLESALRRLLR